MVVHITGIQHKLLFNFDVYFIEACAIHLIGLYSTLDCDI